MKITSKPSAKALDKLAQDELYHSKLAKAASKELKKLGKSASKQMKSSETLPEFEKEEKYHGKKASKIIKLINTLKDAEKEEHEQLAENIIYLSKGYSEIFYGLINERSAQIKAKKAKQLALKKTQNQPPTQEPPPLPQDSEDKVDPGPQQEPEETETTPQQPPPIPTQKSNNKVNSLRSKRKSTNLGISRGIGSAVGGTVGAVGQALGSDVGSRASQVGQVAGAATTAMGKIAKATLPIAARGLRGSRIGKTIAPPGTRRSKLLKFVSRIR